MRRGAIHGRSGVYRNARASTRQVTLHRHALGHRRRTRDAARRCEALLAPIAGDDPAASCSSSAITSTAARTAGRDRPAARRCANAGVRPRQPRRHPRHHPARRRLLRPPRRPISRVAAFQWFMQHGLAETLISYGVDYAGPRVRREHPRRRARSAKRGLGRSRRRTAGSSATCRRCIEEPDLFVAHAMWDVDEPRRMPAAGQSGSTGSRCVRRRYSGTDKEIAPEEALASDRLLRPHAGAVVRLGRRRRTADPRAADRLLDTRAVEPTGRLRSER